MTKKQAARKLSGIMHRLSVLRIETDRVREEFVSSKVGSARLAADVNQALIRARAYSEITESDVIDAWHLLLYREYHPATITYQLAGRVIVESPSIHTFTLSL